MALYLWIAAAVLLLIAGFGLLRFWRRTTAPRLVTCPETQSPHVVELDPAHRLRDKLHGGDGLWLRDCSRWPERADCGQPCLNQISEAPDGCRVRSLLDEYYADKSCALCGKEFGAVINWYEHEPGFIDENRQVLSWQDIPPEQLPEIMQTHLPVCWDCKLIEQVRQEHPERITDRPAH